MSFAVVPGLVVLGVMGSACSGPSSTAETQQAPDSARAGAAAVPDSLTGTHRPKLDHALTLLLREGPDNLFFDYQMRTRGDSVATYGVLVRTDAPTALAESALALGDGESTIVTAFLTVDEIRRAARLESVTSIANPSRAELY